MIRVVQQAAQFSTRPSAATPSASVGSRVLTMRRAEDNAALAGAAVTVDGTITRTADSSGRVEFPASLLPPGQHALFIRGADGRTLSMTVTVGPSGDFTQTVHIAGTAQGASSPAPAPPSPLTLAGNMPGGKVGDVVSVAYGVSGGIPPYEFSISAGALPPGMSDLTGGVTSGSYTTADDYAFTVHVADSAGAEKTLDQAVHVAPAPGPGTWVDITNDEYWTSTGYSWSGSEWDLNAAPSCAHMTGLNPTAACIAANSTATKLRVTVKSIDATDGTGPNWFPAVDNVVDAKGSSVELGGPSPGDTTFADVVIDPFTPFASTSEALSATSRCLGNYESDNYQFLKIEVFVP